MTATYSVNDHFTNKAPSVRALYDQLLSILRTFGPVIEDPKKTSIHLNLKFDHQIKSPRIEKAEQISAKRFHHKVRISSPKDLDEELKAWLKEACLLSE